MEGLTGFIKFDSQGLRTFFHLNVLELSTNGLIVVGTWNPSDGANFTRAPTVSPPQLEESLANRTLIVSSKLVTILIFYFLKIGANYVTMLNDTRLFDLQSDPYFMLKESSKSLSGNDRFEGFVVDVIDEVSKLLGFNYILQVVGDSNYGSYNPETGEWNG